MRTLSRAAMAVSAFVVALGLAEPIHADLIHHWTLDETDGLQASDRTCNGAADLVGFEFAENRQWVEGEKNGALDLGVDGLLGPYLAANLRAVDGSTNGGFTVCMWVNPGEQILNLGEYQLVGTPGDVVGFTIMNFDGELRHDRVLLFWDGNLPSLHVGTTTLEPGEWYHVAIVSTGPGGDKLYYVNGELEDQALFLPSQGGTQGIHPVTNAGWGPGVGTIGAFGAGARAHGSIIDDVRIYDHPLTGDELQDVMDEVPGLAPRILNLNPENDNAFHDPDDGLQFDVVPAAAGATIAAEDIRLFLNGVDVSGDLVITGDGDERNVEYLGLEADLAYSARIEAIDSEGSPVCLSFSFGTLTQSVDGLVHEWRFDETSGLVALDSGSARNGNLMGFELDDDGQWIRAVCDNGLDLGVDGTINNFVQAQMNAVSAFETGGYTIAMWLNPGEQIRTLGEYQLVSTPGDAVGFTIMNYEGELRHDRVLLFWDGSLPDLHVGTTTLEPGTWYHVAITSTGSGGEKLYYINGELEEQVLFLPSQGGVEGFHPGTSDGWAEGTGAIGAIGGGARAHDSIVDDVRIYNRALDEDEVFDVLEECDPVFCEALTLSDQVPAPGDSFADADAGLSFTVSTPNSGDGFTIAVEDITVRLDGVDVSDALTVGGTSTAREVSFDGLAPGNVYRVEILVTDGCSDLVRRYTIGTLERCGEPNLIHRWKLDETSGSRAVDCAGGAHGALIGFPTDDSQWIDGVVDGALDYGSDASFNNTVEFETPGFSGADTGGFTVAMWINPGERVDRLGEHQLFATPGDAIGWSIMNWDAEGVRHDRVLLFWDGSTPDMHVGTTTLEPGNWYHVAITTTGVGGEKRYWVNGVEDEQVLFRPSQGGVEGVHPGTRDGWGPGLARIGSWFGLAGRYHDSIIDDVRIYDTALDEDRIAELAEGAPPVGAVFHRGDADGNDFLQLTDGVFVLNFLFTGGPEPRCRDAADADDNGTLQLNDGIFIFNYLFLGGPAMGAPGIPGLPCGPDPTEDGLDCVAYPPCE